MVTYHLHPVLVLRSPLYNYQLYANNNLINILNQPIFRQAIYLSSQVFYNELQKANFEIDKLDAKAVNTLKKYFNRMCFRPTPFALCSALGSLNWGDDETHIEFTAKNLIPHIQLSYAKNIEYATLLVNKMRHNATYKINASFYKTGNQYRFIRSNLDNAQTEFVIDSIVADKFFIKMFKYLQEWRNEQQIINYTKQETGCTISQANDYFKWLNTNQVVQSSLQANITGIDYLKKLLCIQKVKSYSFKHIQKVFNVINQINVGNLDKLTAIAGDLNSTDFYVNLEVKLPNAKLASRYQTDIIDALSCLDTLTPTPEPAGLIEFKQRFNQKFDGQTIPLLTALDPEVGLGYNNLAVEESDINIAANIIGAPISETRAIRWTDAHTLLFNKWKGAAHQQNPIILTDSDIKDLKKNDSISPNGISVMFRVVDDKVLIESAGGTSASALIGRFTPFNSSIEQLARDMADKEALYNPDVIFAEIAHICHDKTANIDRRENIYPYEIPVLVQSTMAEDHQIPLSDLWVSVIKGSIILQSKKLNKRVIPRLSSAFNYTRNDLAVFRFLCDLQKSGVKTTFGFNLNQFFPGLDFYPRVEYKNSILHLAYWNIKTELFTSVFKTSTPNKLNLFSNIKSELKLPAYIALTQHDHQLVFNIDHEADVLFFLDIIKGQQQITVKEYLLPSPQSPVVKGANGQPHINQFITSIYHQQRVYHSQIPNLPGKPKNNRTFAPGSEWLYLKIYCHPVRSNQLLNDVIAKLVKKLKNDSLINQWFYVRYTDPDYHIRLRLKIVTQKHQPVLSLLHTLLKQYINNNFISHYETDTYHRELERYSHQFMPEFEYSFYAASNLTLSFLKRHSRSVSPIAVIEFAVVTVYDILITLGLEGKALIEFLDKLSASFCTEFNYMPDLKYQLDVEYRKQKQIMELVLKNSEAYYNNLNLKAPRLEFILSLASLKKNVTAKQAWKNKWIADLIHMHLNRLFVNDWRKQEMLIYYFMLKHQKSVQVRNVIS